MLASCLVAAALGGCGDDTSATSTGTGATTGSVIARPGGTLTVAVGTDVACADPQQVGSLDTLYSLRQTVDSLTDQDPETGQIVPWLAERWDVAPDATTFTFHLRPGATFSDGSPVDAQAVKDNFDGITTKLKGLSSLGIGYLAGYVGTTVVDRSTARVTFKQPNASFLQATSTPSLGLIAQSSLAKPPAERCAQGVVGSGPFTLAEYKPSRSIALAKRQGYGWGSSLWTKKGDAYLDKVVFQIVPETGARTGALRSGQVDLIAGVIPSDEPALAAAGLTLKTIILPGTNALWVNNAAPLLKYESIRKAILVGIDRSVLVRLFPKGTTPATSILAPTSPGYKDESALVTYDPAKARSLLEADGWKAGGDGIRSKDGVRLSISIGNPGAIQSVNPEIELIQQQLQQVGIEVTIDQIPVANIGPVRQSGSYDILIASSQRPDPDLLRTQFSSRQANSYRLQPSELDTLLDEQNATTDKTRRNEFVGRAQDYLLTHAIVIPLVNYVAEFALSPKVNDLKHSPSGVPALHDTWIDR